VQYLMVAIGGALGALSRYAVYNAAAFFGFASFHATLLINALGALAIGILYVWIVEQSALQSWGQPLLTVGFLGAFTTYSTYSLDAWRLIEQGQVITAIGYLLVTLVVCLLATWLGVTLTRAVS
jgi:fluoride exporter